MDNIEEIMEKTATRAAEATIEKLMAKGLIRIDNRSAIDKTINLLYKYEQLKLSDQPSTLKRVAQVDVALEQIRDDPFYAIIPLYYFEKETRENIAEYFNVEPECMMMVGDDLRDVQAAKNFGCKSVLITRNDSTPQESEKAPSKNYGQDYTVSGLEELLEDILQSE